MGFQAEIKTKKLIGCGAGRSAVALFFGEDLGEKSEFVGPDILQKRVFNAFIVLGRGLFLSGP